MMTTASLERVMDGLGENEKYNAVLQGLSGILMGKKKGKDVAGGTFEEVFQLLDEMHANRIKCTIRSASAVVDAATATTNISVITQGAVLKCELLYLVLDMTYRLQHNCITQYSSTCSTLLALVSATRFRTNSVLLEYSQLPALNCSVVCAIAGYPFYIMLLGGGDGDVLTL